MKFKGLFNALLLLTFTAGNAWAATSALNNNVRIFEDTIWLAVFTLMIVAGWKLQKLSSGGATFAYWLLALAGLSGWLWKGIGLFKRVIIVNEPKWLFSLTRETFEGLTGIILAIACLVLVLSISRLYRA